MEIKHLHSLFGARLEGVDVRRLDDQGRNAIIFAAERYGLIVIPGQNIDDEALAAFASAFGELAHDSYGKATTLNQRIVFPISNLDANGRIRSLNERMRMIFQTNNLWHTDSTFLRPRAAFSMLLGRIIPPLGGETEFCDTRIAYDELDEVTKRQIAGIRTYHSPIHSSAKIGFSAWSDAERTQMAPIARPVVHLHAPTGRMALCLASHMANPTGLSEKEGSQLIDELIAHATRDHLVYTHRWRTGDLLVWDDRCTMHRARPFDDIKYIRDMRALRVNDLSDSVALKSHVP